MATQAVSLTAFSQFFFDTFPNFQIQNCLNTQEKTSSTISHIEVNTNMHKYANAQLQEEIIFRYWQLDNLPFLGS